MIIKQLLLIYYKQFLLKSKFKIYFLVMLSVVFFENTASSYYGFSHLFLSFEYFTNLDRLLLLIIFTDFFYQSLFVNLSTSNLSIFFNLLINTKYLFLFFLTRNIFMIGGYMFLFFSSYLLYKCFWSELLLYNYLYTAFLIFGALVNRLFVIQLFLLFKRKYLVVFLCLISILVIIKIHHYYKFSPWHILLELLLATLSIFHIYRLFYLRKYFLYNA